VFIFGAAGLQIDSVGSFQAALLCTSEKVENDRFTPNDQIWGKTLVTTNSSKVQNTWYRESHLCVQLIYTVQYYTDYGLRSVPTIHLEIGAREAKIDHFQRSASHVAWIMKLQRVKVVRGVG
jgi:hypothetical protein